MATARRTARAAGSGHGIGSLNQTMRPSPANQPTVASNSRISSPIAVWNERMTSITSSGSVLALKPVQPRRSANSTAISRRWLSRMASPCVRSTRQAQATGIAAGASVSSQLVDLLEGPAPRACGSSSASSAVCALNGVVVVLDPEAGSGRAARSSCWSNGFVRKSSAPASIASTRTSRGVGGQHHDRQERRSLVLAQAPAHLEARPCRAS